MKTIKNNLRKIEEGINLYKILYIIVCFNIKIRGSEYPIELLKSCEEGQEEQ